MKSEIEIVDDIYNHIRQCGMMDQLKGDLHKDQRLEPFSDEDVTISILANELVDDVQEVYVNVNIYVRDINVRGQRSRNRKRLGQICKLARQALWVGGIGQDYTFHLNRQRVFEVQENETTPEHLINNKLFYQVINE